MFDFSFGELLLLAVVALLVLGPERLPKVARLAGLWIRKARTQWNAVKAELENEIADDELRRNLREASAAMREGMQQVRAFPDALVSTSPVADAAPAMTASDDARRSSPQPAPGHTSDAPANAPEPTQHDPASPQLSLLDPDTSLEQMTALPSSSRSRPDGSRSND